MKRKTKRFFSYFIYSIFIVVVALFIVKGRQSLRIWVSRNYQSFPLAIYDILFPCFIAFLIALPYLKDEKIKEGKWKFDWIKFLSIGIPALYLGSFTLKFFLDSFSLWVSVPFYEYICRLWEYIYPFELMSKGVGHFVSLSGIFVFLYVIVISLYKTEDLE